MNVKRTKSTPEQKKRFVLYKSKKNWVVKAVIFGAVIPGAVFVSRASVASEDIVGSSLSSSLGQSTSTTSTLEPLSIGIKPLLAVTNTIDTISDTTSVGESTQNTYTNADYMDQNGGIFELRGNGVESSGTGPNKRNQATGKSGAITYFYTPSGGTNIAVLTPASSQRGGSDTLGAAAVSKTVSMNYDWTFDFNILLSAVKSSNQTVGDYIGFIISPSPVGDSSLGRGGGQGIQGYAANSVSFGLDFYYNSNYGDNSSISTNSQYLGFRQTDGSKNFLAYNSFPSGTTVTGGDVITSYNGSTSSSSNQWSGTNYTSPNISGKCTVVWTASNQTLSVTTNGKTYTYQNLNLGTQELYIGTVSTDGTAGPYSQRGTSLNSFAAPFYRGTVKVNYIDTNSNTLKASTTLKANAGDSLGKFAADTIGINIGSPNAATDVYSFDAPSIQGYHLVKNGTPDVTVVKDVATRSGSTVTFAPATNQANLNVKYEADQQLATLTAKMIDSQSAVSTPVTIPSGDQNRLGATGQSITFTTKDSDLAKAGYTYTVTGADGVQYATLAAALAANATNSTYNSTTTFSGYDTSGNATYSTDTGPQNFVVNYTAANVDVKYAVMDANGTITDKTSALASTDVLTPTQPTIGQTLASTLTTSVTSDPATNTTTFQTNSVIPHGQHLTGVVYWNANGTSVPTSALKTSDVTVVTANQEYAGTYIYQYAPDNQEAQMSYAMATDSTTNAAYPVPPSGLPASVTKDGVTGGSFTFTPYTNVPSGWHVDHIDTSSTKSSIAGTFDNTDNGTNAASADTAKQTYVVYLAPDDQTLNISYAFPAGHDLTSSLTAGQISQTAKSNTNFQSVSIPQIAGYTSNYTFSGTTTTATTIPAILSDTTSNWNTTLDAANSLDGTPQNVSVTYVAQARKITLNTTPPTGSPTSTDITTGSDGHSYVTDGRYDAVSIPQVNGYTSMVSVNGGTSQAMTTYASGSFGSSDITLNVTYVAWIATVNYYVQEVDGSGNKIGSLEKLPAPNDTNTQGAGYDFVAENGDDYDEQTTNLLNMSAIPTGYHVVANHWTSNSKGTGTVHTPSYTDDWDWANMTQTSQGSYTATIIYDYTPDTQKANIVVQGIPAGDSAESQNGTNNLTGMNGLPYEGVTDSSQTVTLPVVSGYNLRVTDATGNVVSTNSNSFTFVFDSESDATNGITQTYTATYTAKTADIQVNYQYSSGTITSVARDTNTARRSFTAPNLPAEQEIQAQTGEEYNITVATLDPDGYHFVITDDRGNTYPQDTNPEFTSDGSPINYTVTYYPIADYSKLHIQFREATYDATGEFTYTDEEVTGLDDQVKTGALGQVQPYSITTSSSDFTVPSGWTLDPMGATVANGIDDTTGMADNDSANPNGKDNLNGSNTAKQLTFALASENYTIYLARDIQNVNVEFRMDGNSTTMLPPNGLPQTINQGGRTGKAFTVDTTSFARSGYTYVITDGNGDVVSDISGIYDNTSNKNAAQPIKNDGDGDLDPQEYKVTYTPCTQQATISVATDSDYHASTDLGDATGPSGTNIELQDSQGNDISDSSLFVQGYYYTVIGPDGRGYSTYQEALANNKTFDYTDNTSSTDSSVQAFTVKYIKCMQEVDLLTDSTDPNGASTVETVDGKTGETISFTSTDTTLARSGYTYKVTGPDSVEYDTLADALTANDTFDATDNGNRGTDSTPQKFVATYTANAQTVNIRYVYADGDGDSKSGAIPDADFATAPTNAQKSQTKVTNANGDEITVPSLAGYTPNTTAVTPKFTVDSNGDLDEPTITVTYTANKETATFKYSLGSKSGSVITVNSDFTSYATSTGAPTGAEGVMNAEIFTDAVVQTEGVAPNIPGYDFIGYSVNSGTAVDETDLSTILYADGANVITLIYQPKAQTVNIEYVYDSNDNSPKNGTIPAGDFATQPSVNSVDGVSNTIGTPITDIPTVAGYTTTTTTITPDFTINSDGTLKTPTITVVYTANNQSATIQYVDPNGNDLSARTGGAPASAVGVTDQVIGLGTPAVSGYTLTSITQNSQDITSSPGTATFVNGTDTIVYTYTPNALTSTVNYIYQLPSNYDDGTVSYANNNGQLVSGMSNGGSLTSYTDATNYTLDSVTSTDLKLIADQTNLPSGFKLSSTEKIISTADGQWKTEYVFKVVPETARNLTINYVDENGKSLLQYIPTNETPTIAASSIGQMDFTTSGSIDIPGYTYTSFNKSLGTGNASGTNNTIVANSGEDDQVANYVYTANSQSVTVRYLYDANNDNSLAGQAVDPSDLTGATAYTQFNGKSNGDTIDSSSPTGASFANAPFTAPTVVGYTASVAQYTPSFTTVVGSNDLLTPVITITYTAAKDNTAKISYVDANGKDLSSKAVDSNGNPIAVASSASGTTDAAIKNSGAVTIPGYTIKEIDFTPFSGNTTTVSDPSTVTFSGASTTGSDQLTFVYEPDAKELQVNYLYQNGGKAGQTVSPQQIVHGHTDDAPGTVGADGTGTLTTIAVATPTGYALITNNLQTASWVVDNSGTLRQQSIDYYYKADQTTALIQYGIDGAENQLDTSVPTGTVTGTQPGLTDDEIPVSGPVDIQGYEFEKMVVNDTDVATTVDDAKAEHPVFTPSGTVTTTTTVSYLYTPKQGTVNFVYVDSNGNDLSQNQTLTDNTTYKTGDVLAYSNDTAPDIDGYTKQKTIINNTDIGTNTTGQPTMPVTDVATVQYVYTANEQHALVEFVLEDGTPVDPAQVQAVNPSADANSVVTLSGKTNEVINYATIEKTIPGFTLVTDGTTASGNQRYDDQDDGTDDATAQTVQLVYKKDTQYATVNYLYSTDSGATWKPLSPVERIDGGSGESTDPSSTRIQRDFEGYKLISDGSQGSNLQFDYNSTKDQVINMYFSPYKQAAVTQTDSTDPENANGKIYNGQARGLSNETVTLKNDPSILGTAFYRQGYTYFIQGPDLTWYESLSQALANNNLYNKQGSTTAQIDTMPTPAVLGLTVYPSLISGITPNAVEDESSAVVGTMFGLTSKVLGLLTARADDAPTGTQPVNPPIDVNGTDSDGIDSKSQTFTATYYGVNETAYVQSHADPSGDQIYQSVNGASGDAITTLNVTDSKLYRSGFTYYVTVTTNPSADPTTGTHYDTLQDAITAIATFDTDENTNQIFNVNYVAAQQNAILKTDSSDPQGASTLQTVSGASGSNIAFTKTDANLARTGYTYTVTIGGTTYDTLAEALQGVKVYDSNDLTNGTDDSPQEFVVTYTAMTQTAVLRTTDSDPTGASTETVNGPSDSPIDFSGDDATLAREGYTYTVTGPNGTIYTTLADALSAELTPEGKTKGTPNYDHNNVTNGTDSTPQNFVVTYTPVEQIVKVIVDGTDKEIEKFNSDSTISLTTKDSDLKKSGYTYKVTGPNGTEYTSLSAALAANNTADHNDLTGTEDKTPQNFVVTHTAVTQTANIITKNDPADTANKTIETKTGDSDSSIGSWTTKDDDLTRPNYQYEVKGPDGTTYTTLLAALAATTNYDHNDLTNGEDKTPQDFVVTYTEIKQVVNVVANGGPKNGKTLDSATGHSDTTISLTATDSSLKQDGYTYKVIGPDGTTYDTLAEALTANPDYDNNLMTNGKDGSPQKFEVKYTAVTQSATLTSTTDGKAATQPLEEKTGGSDSKLSFTTTDAKLKKSGYTYTIKASNGKTYNTLAEAIKAVVTYDHNDLTDGKDAKPQVFTVVYKSTSSSSSSGSSSSSNSKDTANDDLLQKLIDAQDGSGLSSSDKKKIAEEVLAGYKDGESGTDYIKDILDKLAPNLSDSEKDSLADDLWAVLERNDLLQKLIDAQAGSGLSSSEKRKNAEEALAGYENGKSGTSYIEDILKDNSSSLSSGKRDDVAQSMWDVLARNDLIQKLIDAQAGSGLSSSEKRKNAEDALKGYESGKSGSSYIDDILKNNSSGLSNGTRGDVSQAMWDVLADNELLQKLIAVQEGKGISRETEETIAQLALDGFKDGKRGAGYIEEILKKYAGHLTDAERKALAQLMWEIISGESGAALPKFGEQVQIWSAVGVLLISGSIILYWRRKKDDSETDRK